MGDWRLEIGDWGLWIGDWGLGLLFVLKGRFIPARGETPGTIYKDLRVLKGRFILQEAGILLNVESPATLGSFDLRL